MPDFVRRIPDGDDRERSICADCGPIVYDNPKVVVGSVVVADGAVLMCWPAIEPRRGSWTRPAGYLQRGETLEEGTARRAWQEARAKVAIGGIPGAAQPHFAAIPHEAIAFSSVTWALEAWQQAGPAPLGVPAGNSAHDRHSIERHRPSPARSSP